MMKIPKNNVLYFLTFAFGVGVGAVWMKEYFKSLYRDIADCEIESVKKVLVEKNKNKPPIHIDTEGFLDIPERPTREEELLQEPPTDITVEKIEYSDDLGDIEIISPVDFGSLFDYEPISLVWYTGDGTLVCDDEDITEDIDFCIGSEALDHFGEYEDDAIHVRNHARKCDYEVLLDSRKWSDVKRL